MKEQFVPYDLSLKLKELGFDEECLGYYLNEDLAEILEIEELLCIDEKHYQKSSALGKVCSAPLWQQVFKWFRDKHKLSGEVYYLDGGWHFDIDSLINGWSQYTSPPKRPFETFESAQEAVVCKLIKMLDNGQ